MGQELKPGRGFERPFRIQQNGAHKKTETNGFGRSSRLSLTILFCIGCIGCIGGGRGRLRIGDCVNHTSYLGDYLCRLTDWQTGRQTGEAGQADMQTSRHTGRKAEQGSEVINQLNQCVLSST